MTSHYGHLVPRGLLLPRQSMIWLLLRIYMFFVEILVVFEFTGTGSPIFAGEKNINPDWLRWVRGEMWRRSINRVLFHEICILNVYRYLPAVTTGNVRTEDSGGLLDEGHIYRRGGVGMQRTPYQYLVALNINLGLLERTLITYLQRF